LALGFLYGSFNLAYIGKDFIELGLSGIKTIGSYSYETIKFLGKIIGKPLGWMVKLSDPGGKFGKIGILLAIIIFLWIWTSKLQRKYTNNQ